MKNGKLMECCVCSICGEQIIPANVFVRTRFRGCVFKNGKVSKLIVKLTDVLN